MRQGTRALLKQMWQAIGVETELRNIDAAVFFGGDQSSPDTYQKFYADIEMYTNLFNGTDPEAYLNNWTCGEIPSPKNNWLGSNMPRYCNPAYDALAAKLATTAAQKIIRHGENERHADARRRDDSVDSSWQRLCSRNSLGGVKLNVWDSQLWNVAIGTYQVAVSNHLRKASLEAHASLWRVSDHVYLHLARADVCRTNRWSSASSSLRYWTGSQRSDRQSAHDNSTRGARKDPHFAGFGRAYSYRYWSGWSSSFTTNLLTSSNSGPVGPLATVSRGCVCSRGRRAAGGRSHRRTYADIVGCWHVLRSRRLVAVPIGVSLRTNGILV